MLELTQHKTCRACGTDKPVSEFPTNNRNRDGLHSYCKVCQQAKTKEYYQTPAGKESMRRGAAKLQEAGYYKTGKGAIAKFQISAEAKGLICTLTQAELEIWWQTTPNNCHYCGSTIEEYRSLRDHILTYTGLDYEVLKFGRFFRSPKHQAIKDMTIDRRDNSQGYKLGNIVKACWICNSLKNDFWTEAQMQMVAPQIMRDLRHALVKK